MNLDDDVLVQESVVCIELLILLLDILLQLLERHLLVLTVVIDEEAVWYLARRVVLHVQTDWAPGLGTSPDVIELEAHESLHKRCRLTNTLLMLLLSETMQFRMGSCHLFHTIKMD